MTRTALELIGQSGLGYSFDPLTDDGVPHPYGKAAKSFAYVYFPGIIGSSSDFADNTYKANYVQDGVHSKLFPEHMLENWNS